MDQSHKLTCWACRDDFFFFFKEGQKEWKTCKNVGPSLFQLLYSCRDQFACFPYISSSACTSSTPTTPDKKNKKMKRPLLRGNHSSVGLSAPRSLISCGTTSESACRAAITQALGALGRRKMDLEGICGQSSPSLLCIRRHGTSTALVQVSSDPTPTFTSFAFHLFVLSGAVLDGCKKI